MSEMAVVLTGGLVLFTGIGVLLVLKLDALTFLYDIHTTDVGITFRVFSILTVYVLPFSKIENVKEVAGGYSFFAAYNFKNRFFRTTYLIQKRTGVFTRKILVTPADASAFTYALTRAGVQIVQ